jgi:hypothetical protein
MKKTCMEFKDTHRIESEEKIRLKEFDESLKSLSYLRRKVYKRRKSAVSTKKTPTISNSMHAEQIKRVFCKCKKFTEGFFVTLFLLCLN